MNGFGRRNSWAALPPSGSCAFATAKDATSMCSPTPATKTLATFLSTWIVRRRRRSLAHVLHESESFVFEWSGETDIAHDMRDRKDVDEQARALDVAAHDDASIVAAEQTAESDDDVAVVVDEKNDLARHISGRSATPARLRRC